MNRPLRILHTEAAKGMGGQEIYIFRHMQVMRARGHEVSLLCQPDARLATLARDDGFTVHTLRMGGLARLLRGVWSVSRLVRRERYDVVNTTSRRDALIAAAGARLGGTPLVVRSRHLMSPVNSLLTYTGLPHRVLTVSSFVKQLLADRGIPAERIGIVPPIAVPPRWSEIRKADPWQCLQDARAQVRAELGFGEQDIVVGCVAVLREPKGHADLLQAMIPLCKANPDLHLVIVGDGQAVTERLQAMCAEHGLQRQVHLLGYRDGACRLMAGFDIFALASHKEAAGTVFLEAAYVGVPIVATRVGGVPEMVVDGSNAILTRLGDNAALTGALRLLVDDPERRRQMGRAGWDWMHGAHRFTPDGHGEATEHYYHQWLKELGHG
ncbi:MULTISPECIES: glycosyltransferase family 4 protein [Stenotrophomonas]|jgi:glycosyltransferase involved in cell wall biosynthesis|uniref:Glycosyltransferase family 4 protein n=1 Tax=Stenotrophomonas maltophilia TaxID=40324 RepID=A0A2U4H7R6_STEMA|nr:MULTISPECIES: glycosyltransferase family 4 protein [Stenotrophomonas]NED62220.1 glycosyltransferase family 4 protein [Streptomyces sp. SID10244]EKU9960937.1 glycosyltransferase family 4 protein [Stenotrophomonas maltophilia]EKU9987055.1 glycosyltransferase family 4 protein [Stenotrophomonas maltophilia]ELN2585775.1 glycosyltransferase family 4 protein [Stenotrophomonas maltophilia]ELN2594052.1 glycosyltransferase family 4 protein [Stenotrophomonas maltophilia]